MSESPVSTAPATQPAGPLLADLLCFDLYSMSRAMTGLYRPLLEPMGLTYPQFLMIVVLQRRDAVTIRDIGAETRLDHGTLTPLLRRLATHGLVHLGRGTDARTVVVSLTAAGERLRPEIENIHCRLRELVGLTDSELADLQHGLQHLSAGLGRSLSSGSTGCGPPRSPEARAAHSSR